jgi:protein-S-isoprenylcysteine O-methyltransferase Ste14
MTEFLPEHFRVFAQPWWLVVALYEFLLAGAWTTEHLLLRRIRHRTGDPIQAAQRDRRYAPMWILYFVLLQAALIRARHWHTVLPHSWVLIAVGVGLALAGIALRVYAIRWLGQNFSYVVNVGEQHTLVTTGPYRRVRHPAYSGLLLFVVGLTLTLGDIWLLVFVPAVAAVIVFRRIRREERSMKDRFGEQYDAWRRRTALLIPGLL